MGVLKLDCRVGQAGVVCYSGGFNRVGKFWRPVPRSWNILIFRVARKRAATGRTNALWYGRLWTMGAKSAPRRGSSRPGWVVGLNCLDDSRRNAWNCLHFCWSCLLGRMSNARVYSPINNGYNGYFGNFLLWHIFFLALFARSLGPSPSVRTELGSSP